MTNTIQSVFDGIVRPWRRHHSMLALVPPSRLWLALMLLLASGCATLQRPAPQPTLPRIGVRRGEGRIGTFVERESGRTFQPVGFNHTLLGDHQWHATFNAGKYDPEKMDASLAAMARAGANTIRVWAWGETKDASGVTGEAGDCGVNPRYIDNFVDFLRRCRAHQIYVAAILDETPLNATYAEILKQADAKQTCPAVSDYNRQYFTPGLIEAKAALIRDFIGAVKERDATLLPVMLGWSFSNEAWISEEFGPFNQHAGVVTTANGQGYDMASREQRQACWDEGIVYWANRLTEAVKQVDPEALTTVGMWTSDAQGRLPVNGLLEPRADHRYPPRPSVLAATACQIDFLDIHVYPFQGETTVNRETNEYPQLRQSGKPVLAGEYGIFRSQTKAEEARAHEQALRRDIQGLGYSGPLLWLWEMISDCPTYVAEDLGLR